MEGMKTMELCVHRKFKMLLVVLLLFLAVSACTKDETESISLAETQVETVQEEEKRIYVYVCGAVLNAGVYELPEGSRVYEAVELAGGFSEHAAVAHINQAEMLEDETRLYIPTLGEVADQQSEEDGKVNLNTASKEELMSLPGVGEAKADSIIDYREVNGRFQTIEDVMLISGIKEGLFEKIKDYITV